MVSRILISIALLCSSVGFSQDENGLTFSQVLLVELTEEGVVVPEGKVWKISSCIYTHNSNTNADFHINSLEVDIFTYFSGGGITAVSNPFPIWIPPGTILSSGSAVSALSIIEFNTD